MFDVEREVKEKTKLLWIAVGVFWIVGIVILSIAAASFGWPWYISFVAGAAWGYVMLVLEGSLEDRLLVAAYGPSKRPR